MHCDLDLWTSKSIGHILDSWGVCMWSFVMIGVKGKQLCAGNPNADDRRTDRQKKSAFQLMLTDYFRKISRGETIRVHHDTICITMQSPWYDTYHNMLYTCTCTAEKWKNILIFGSQFLQLEINLWIMHNAYGTTNNEFLHRKYFEQSKILVLNNFFPFKIP